MATIDRTVLITGGNSGLGLECARALSQETPGWHVVIASRDAQRSQQVVDELRAGATGAVEARSLDLGSLADTRRFAAALLADLSSAALPPLRALVCNAGLQFTDRQATVDGFEATFAINHLGHYLLTHRLLGVLQAPGRILFVGSGTHDPAERTGMPHPRYRGARSLADPNDDGGDADPGLMPGTGLGRHYPAWMQIIWRNVLPVLTVLPKVNSTRTSGRNLAWLTSHPSLEGATAQYFRARRAVPSSKASYDRELQRELWEGSAALVGLQAEESPLAVG